MNIRKTLPVFALTCTLLLAGCAKEVTYDEFHKASTNVEKSDYTSLVAKTKGTYEGEKVDAEDKFTLALGVWVPTQLTGTAGVAGVFLVSTANLVVKSDSAKYYVDNGAFQVTEEKNVMKWNKYGLVTYVKNVDSENNSNYEVTFTYSK